MFGCVCGSGEQSGARAFCTCCSRIVFATRFHLCRYRETALVYNDLRIAARGVLRKAYVSCSGFVFRGDRGMSVWVRRPTTHLCVGIRCDCVRCIRILDAYGGWISAVRQVWCKSRLSLYKQRYFAKGPCVVVRVACTCSDWELHVSCCVAYGIYDEDGVSCRTICFVYIVFRAKSFTSSKLLSPTHSCILPVLIHFKGVALKLSVLTQPLYDAMAVYISYFLRCFR